MAKRQCKGINKRGNPCQSAPLIGKDHCFAHDKESQESGRFGGAQEGAGRPRRPREIELIQEVAEEFKKDLRQVYIDGLTAERAMVVANAQTAYVQFVPDHSHRLRTAAEIQDRLHGKPRAAGDQADLMVDVNLNLVTDHELRDAAAALRRGLAQRRSIEPGGTDAGG